MFFSITAFQHVHNKNMTLDNEISYVKTSLFSITAFSISTLTVTKNMTLGAEIRYVMQDVFQHNSISTLTQQKI
jgi:hypothetical protein